MKLSPWELTLSVAVRTITGSLKFRNAFEVCQLLCLLPSGPLLGTRLDGNSSAMPQPNRSERRKSRSHTSFKELRLALGFIFITEEAEIAAACNGRAKCAFACSQFSAFNKNIYGDFICCIFFLFWLLGRRTLDFILAVSHSNGMYLHLLAGRSNA